MGEGEGGGEKEERFLSLGCSLYSDSFSSRNAWYLNKSLRPGSEAVLYTCST